MDDLDVGRGFQTLDEGDDRRPGNTQWAG
jgi:hypothetical protein